MTGDGELYRLRIQAEKLVTQSADTPTEPNAEEYRQLIHDLRVHQVELEMQNEELRASRNELEQARDAFALLYNQSPVGYLSLDGSGIIRKANRTFLEMVGMADGDVKGTAFSELIADEDRKVFLGRFSAIYRQPADKHIDLRLRSGHGNLAVRMSARREDGGKALLVAIIDISEQARAEAAIHALLEEKQLLLREVHHRIKNNMNIAISFLSLQSSAAKDPVARATIENAERRMYSMMVIYDRLYRSEDYQSLSTTEYFDQLLDIISKQFDRPTVRIESDLDDFLLDSSSLYPVGIMLNELITNAFKYAFKERNEGLISVRLKKASDSTATLTVEDNGCGMVAGTDGSGGFGFLMMRSLAEQIGATLEISAATGGGTSCTVTFPIRSGKAA